MWLDEGDGRDQKGAMQREADAYDVLIVGAGLAGATLALALGQAGLRVAVVDGQPLELRSAPEFDGRALAVAYANMRQWRALGVAESILPDAQPITRIVVADGPGPGAAAPAGAPSFLGFDVREDGQPGPDGGMGEPLGWMVESRHAHATLHQALANSGAAIFAPEQIKAIATDARTARVTLGSGQTLQAALVVGADGRASAVREAAGIGVNGWDYGQSGVVATVALARPHDGAAHQYFLPGGPLAILPLTGDRASLVWTERTRRARALAEASTEAFEAYLARRFGDQLGRPRLIGPRSCFPLRLQVAQARIAPRTALVGDAAAVIHPIAGQGLNLGLKDVAALAEVLAEAHRLGEDPGAEVVLARYARWRRFDTAALATATDAFNRLFAIDHPLARVARGAGFTLVNQAPMLKRLFVREAGAEFGDVPRLLKGEAP